MKSIFTFSFLIILFSGVALSQMPFKVPGTVKDASGYGNPPGWQWAQQYGGTSADVGYDIVTDESGNMYITGSFSGMLNFPGNSFTSIGKCDAFVAKFTSNGTILWFKQLSASAADKIIQSYAIEIDNSGGLFITGYYTGSVTLGTFELPDMGPSNYFYARLDGSGNVELAAGPATSHEGQQTGTAIKVDNNGNIYLLTSNSLDRHSITNYSSLTCFNESGVVQWVNSDSISIFDIEISNNKIFYSGTITGEANVGPFFLDPPYARDAFLARSDLEGNFEWAEIPGHTVNNGESQGYSISIDENGDIYQSGSFRFDIIFGQNHFTSSRTFIVKADQAGGYLWAQQDNWSSPYDICGNSNITITCCSNVLSTYNSTTGERLDFEIIDQSPDKIYYNDYNNMIVTTGDFEQNIYISSFNSSLNLMWLWQFDSDSGFGYNVGTSSDQEGNIYSFNYASNPMDYLGETVGDGMFLAKQDNSGNLIWLKNFYGTRQLYSDGCYVISDSMTASVYITGTFSEPFEIPGVTTLYPGDNGSLYIIRYDLDGNYIWHIQEDVSSSSISLSIDHSGNILVAGTFSMTITIGSQELVSIGDNDVFIAKYNSDGEFLWATRGGGETDEYSGYISTDKQDNIYFAGEFYSENVTFGDQSITLNAGDGNILLAKLNSSGQVLWLKAKGGSPVAWNEDYCFPTSIVTDAEGYSYVKGHLGDSIYFDNTLLTNHHSVKIDYNYFIARFDPSGNTDWVHAIYESRQGQMYNTMDIDSEGNVYFGAQLRDTAWFEDDYMCVNPGYPSEYDLFTAKYSAGGNLEWVKLSPSSTAGGNCQINSITVLGEDDLIMGGYFTGILNLDSYILNSDIMHGMLAYLNGPLSVEESPDLPADFFFIYPNPASERLTLIFSENLRGDMNIVVTDLSGKEMFKSSSVILDSRINLNVSTLPAGVYFLQVTNLNQSKTKKFIIR